MLGRLQEFLDRRGRSGKLRSRFTTVYDKALWGEYESRSGEASVRGSPWVSIAGEAIAKAVHEHNVRSINDIPCGDFNWMPDVLATFSNLQYTGFDIVKPALARNKDRHPKYEFRLLDITTSVPPAADLILCKDLLNHLADVDVKRAISNIRRSGSKFLLASNNPGFENTPLPETAGASRYLDITAPPYNFRQPLWTWSGYLSFWRLADIGECGF